MPASRTASGVGFALAVWLSCAQAHAYQSPTRFADPSDMGGGGGRFFTGSPADGYTCVVCHSAGTATHLKILGLPVSGYTPGQVYRITVDWDDTLKSVAVNLEMTNRAGQTLGALSMPGPDQLSDADLCKPVTNGLPDMHVLTTMPEGRMIGVVPECGGNQATVIWTAPMNAPGTGLDAEAWFSGSLVSADANGKVDGDNTTDFTRVIGLRDQRAPKPSLLAGGCSAAVHDGQQNARVGVAALGCIALLALRRRRRAGHGSPNLR